MNRQKRKIELIVPLAALFLCGVIVLLERFGVTKQFTDTGVVLTDEDYSAAIEIPHDTLILADSSQEVYEPYLDMFTIIFKDMSVGYDIIDLSQQNHNISLDSYRKVVVMMENWDKLTDEIQHLNTWVKNGGSLMAAMTPQPGTVFEVVSNKMGIMGGTEEYAELTGFHMLNNSMIGAEEGENFYFDSVSKESVMTSLNVHLSDSADISVEGADNRVPIIWSNPYGEGRFVVVNDILSEKYQRGFLATAYSLLEDVTMYPVINASAYYLDDFPSPVPGGNGAFIERDYGVGISTFYSTIWWPEILQWEKDYGIRHTGLIIEDYSDQVEAPFPRNEDAAQFVQYGNMLLNSGGELGYHGYNHMPLCQEGIDENRQLGDYELWKSFEDMKGGLAELQSFSNQTFPDEMFQVYVPPSNIISDTGLQAIKEQCPEIKVIASSYLHDQTSRELEQEFEVAENGFIYTPRITSGCAMDSFQKLTAMAELNLHYVQSHFLHPDDMLDEDRGAALGWKQVDEQFRTVYLDWLKRTVPNIRQVTGSGMGKAVKDFDHLTVSYTWDQDQIQGNVGELGEEAYLMLRLQHHTPAATEGCSVEQITGDLYLVQVTKEQFSIQLDS